MKPRSLRKLLAAFGVALVASLALSALGAGAASAENWYSCKNVGEGKGVYSNSTCSTEGGSKAYAWNKLAASSVYKTTNAGTSPDGKEATPFVLAWTWYGIPVKIICKNQTSEGTLEVPVGGLPETFYSFNACSVAEPETACKVKEGKFSTSRLTGAIDTKSASFTGWAYGQLMGGPVFENCKTTGLNKLWQFQGSWTGSVENNPTTKITFSKAAFNVGPFPGTIDGISKMTTASGELLKIAP